MTDKTRRRDLMRPAQLLGIAFVCAAFAGIITAMSMGAFESVPIEHRLRAWSVAGIIAGVAFIVVLLCVSLLLLAVDPADVEKDVDRPVLLGHEDQMPDEDEAPDGDEQSTPDGTPEK